MAALLWSPFLRAVGSVSEIRLISGSQQQEQLVFQAVEKDGL